MSQLTELTRQPRSIFRMCRPPSPGAASIFGGLGTRSSVNGNLGSIKQQETTTVPSPPPGWGGRVAAAAAADPQTSRLSAWWASVAWNGTPPAAPTEVQ